MEQKINIAIVGATGVVGQEVIKVLEKRNFPIGQLYCFASSKSLGKTILFQGEKLVISPMNFQNVDLAFLCAGATFSKKNRETLKNTQVIDLSSAFRSNPNIPLVIPEINSSLLEKKSLWISSPNCVVSLLLTALFPLHTSFQIEKIIGSTYQSASGGGQKMIDRLLKKPESPRDVPYAFNVFSHDSALLEDGFNEEERKIEQEIQKILGIPKLSICMTCIRVPVLRAHCIAVHVTFQKPVVLKEAYRLLSKAPGIQIFEDKKENRFATPFDATNQDKVFVSRLRIDPNCNRTLVMWVVGDQLLKGAALNAVQIAETIRLNDGFYTSNQSDSSQFFSSKH